jgi:hypothetical protein
MAARMMNALVRRAAEGDWEALEALRSLEALVPSAMTAALCEARNHYSLAELATVVGTTRSAVSQRTQRRVHPLAPGCGHALCVGMKRCRTPDTPEVG